MRRATVGRNKLRLADSAPVSPAPFLKESNATRTVYVGHVAKVSRKIYTKDFGGTWLTPFDTETRIILSSERGETLMKTSRNKSFLSEYRTY